MMRIASNLMRNIKIPHFNRFEVSSDLIKAMIATRLTAGAWRTTAVKDVFEALRLTDSAMSDYHIGSPPAYAWGILKETPCQNLSREKIKAKTNDFWNDQLALNQSSIEEVKGSDQADLIEMFELAILRCKSKIA